LHLLLLCDYFEWVATRLARVIARLRVLRAIVRIRAPPGRIELLPPDAFPSSDSEEGNQSKKRDCENEH